jgi:cation diffusion facilitator family transporter
MGHEVLTIANAWLARGELLNKKERVAAISVAAAVFLVSTKLVVGLATNSLGILSEAMHSGIDLLAAAMTLMAVRWSAHPADEDHQYGHEKIESLSSLAETALLFITCAWITYEALMRLFVHSVAVEVTWASIAIMLLSIVIDFTRSRALMKVAKETRSQALEADAVHFKTDMLSSVVVLIGLGFTLAGFSSFDAIAALGVAAISAYIGYNIWKRSMHTLLDGAPKGVVEQVVEEAGKTNGVLGVQRVRARDGGSLVFVEAEILIESDLPLERADEICHDIEGRLRERIGEGDFSIVARPHGAPPDLIHSIQGAGREDPRIHGIHELRIVENSGSLTITMHVELDGGMDLREAHKVAERLEGRVKSMAPNIASVTTHIEPSQERCKGATCPEEEAANLRRQMSMVVRDFPEVRSYEIADILMLGDRVKVNLICRMDPGIGLEEAHGVSIRLENAIRSSLECVEEISVHMEPMREGDEK